MRYMLSYTILGFFIVSLKANKDHVLNDKTDFRYQSEKYYDTGYFKSKNLNIEYMLRGYFYAASSIEDKSALGGFGGSKNYAQSIDNNNFYINTTGLYLLIDTNRYVTFADKYKGQKVYLVNQTGDSVGFDASDSRLNIIAEVFYNKEWNPVEYLPSSWCGNSYHTVYLKKAEYWEFTCPRYFGKLAVKLRYRLNINKNKTIYSNEINAFINKKQFIEKQGHRPTNIMDPYLD